MNLPPESAWARVQSGGLTDSERMAVAQLNLSYSRLDWAMRSVTRNKAKAPPMQVFIPDIPKPDEPLTFHDWARALLPLAGRRI